MTSKRRHFMKLLQTRKRIRLWLPLALLALIGQLLVASAHSAMMISASASSGAAPSNAVHIKCHYEALESDSESARNLTNSLQLTGSFSDCCDGDCSMAACHFAPAVVNAVAFTRLRFSNYPTYFLGSATVTRRASSLYRPPILG